MTPVKNSVQRGIPCCSGKKGECVVWVCAVCRVWCCAVCVVAVVVVMVLNMGDGHDPLKKNSVTLTVVALPDGFVIGRR